MKNNNFKENFIPAIVLVCICLVVSLARCSNIQRIKSDHHRQSAEIR